MHHFCLESFYPDLAVEEGRRRKRRRRRERNLGIGY